MGQELMRSHYADKSLMKAVDPNREWCDQYEFALAAFCGAAAGLWMHFFSAVPIESALKNFFR